MPDYQDILNDDGSVTRWQGGAVTIYASIEEARVATREADYVQAAQAANRAIWDGINALVALQREWTALDYGTTLDTVDGIAPASVGAVVFDTANALQAVLAAGHATNMARLL